MSLNKNIRSESEYRLVTDGKQLYRLHPNHKIPKGVFEIFEAYDTKAYLSNGRLHQRFAGVQRIQPRNNLKHLVMCIKGALGAI